MLPRVLLDVVEPAGPVHAPENERAFGGRLALADVQDAAFVLVHALDDARGAERARVVGCPPPVG